MNILWQSFRQGVIEGWRGYFAPLRLSPWQAAWLAGKQTGATWSTPIRAWFAEIDQIVVEGPRR